MEKTSKKDNDNKLIKIFNKKNKGRNNKKLNKYRKTKFHKFFKRLFGLFSNEKNSYSFSEVFVLTLISLVIGAFACFSVFTILSGGRNYFKISKELDKFYDAYEALIDNYYGDIDKNELIDNAISGMVSSVGDAYTSYSDTVSTDEFNETVSGVYQGIGCVIQQLNNEIKVYSIYDNSPSEKAGLKIGDIVKSVDEQDANEIGYKNIANYIKNKSDGTISMVIIRDGNEKTIQIKREKIEIPVVSGEIQEVNNKKIGYLKIAIFSSVAAKQFKSKLDELEKSSVDGLIIDVRGNNGGYLSTVTDIASYLLPKGEIIYQVQKNEKKVSTKDKTSAKREYPIAVLVNGNSASASEILAAAIKESYGGYLVGTKTYGKGTVQQVKTLSDGSMIKYTIENWLTPDGNWINKNGIEPTYEIELAEEYYNNPTNENDNQLKKALELISK